MEKEKVYTAVGLMSGTSLDGVDAAIIRTDGRSYVEPVEFIAIPYDEDLRDKLRGCLGKTSVNDNGVKSAEREMTKAHAEAVKALLSKANMRPSDVDVIGFHGQTIFHAPENGVTIQIGDGQLLAEETGIDVIDDFRSADVAAGGEGAPLAPLYHQVRVLSDKVALPAAVLNIGGVANITYIGKDRKVLAFDTGPGNALMDDWARKHTGKDYDEDGKLAWNGHSADYLLEQWYKHPYFEQKPPKSLDRNEWDIAAFGKLGSEASSLSAEDGAATLMVFTAETILMANKHLPKRPKNWYICGGGRHNKTLMKYLEGSLKRAWRKKNVMPVEKLGWNGDATEAECFAYLAVRSSLGLPISLPSTTGVNKPLSGGRKYSP
jgi:anhydro-N-acetylmuramic acid kinase